jgi:hypothetical protein
MGYAPLVACRRTLVGGRGVAWGWAGLLVSTEEWFQDGGLFVATHNPI